MEVELNINLEKADKLKEEANEFFKSMLLNLISCLE